MAWSKLYKLGGLAVLALGVVMGPKAKAAYIVTLQQVGSNVVATGSGSLNVSGLGSPSSGTAPGGIDPGAGSILLAGTSSTPYDIYYPTNMSGVAFLGTSNNTATSSASGSIVGIAGEALHIMVPSSYASGTALGTSTATWDNTSLAALGVTVGSYIWNWGSGASADSFTLNISDAPVPEPASWALLGVGLAGVLIQRRKRVAHR